MKSKVEHYGRPMNESPSQNVDLLVTHGVVITVDDQRRIFADGAVAIDMTLTAPGCPVAGELPKWVADAVADVDGVGEVEVKLVWEPGWTPERMSEDAKLALGMC